MSHPALIILDLYIPWNPYLPWTYQSDVTKWCKHLPSTAVWCQNSVLRLELPLMSTGSRVLSAGHVLTSTTDTAACIIWILHTSAFLFSLYHLETSDILFKFYRRNNLNLWFYFLSKRNWKEIGIVWKSMEACIHSCNSNSSKKRVCFNIINISAYQRGISSKSLRNLNGNAHSLFWYCSYCFFTLRAACIPVVV